MFYIFQVFYFFLPPSATKTRSISGSPGFNLTLLARLAVSCPAPVNSLHLRSKQRTTAFTLNPSWNDKFANFKRVIRYLF